jgi:hypothetical protein
MIARHDFATRLQVARLLLARGVPPAPVHLGDQLDAAADETREIHDRLGAALPLLHPGRAWYQKADPHSSADVRAYLLAGVLGCTVYCCHLRRGGPQPAYVRLPLRRADCARCAQTLRRAPISEDDRCDLCGVRGVVTFVPFAVRHGPALIAGDACPGCARNLGIMEAAS